jgi:nitrogen regulatory protein PII
MQIDTALIQPFMLNKVNIALETIEDFPEMIVSDARGFCRNRGGRERRNLRLDGLKMHKAPPPGPQGKRWQ